MKKILPFVVLFAILIGGLMAAFSYQAPETKTYIALNTIDTQIEENLKVNEQSMTENLSSLQTTVENLITLGQTYTDGTDVTSDFEQFNTAYQNSQTLQSKLTELIAKELTSKLEKTTDKLSVEQKKLADEAINLEKTRLDELSLLLKEIESLNSKLSKVEEMFYTKKPSEAIQYFNGVNNTFSTIEEAYNVYADASTNYFTAKSSLYQAIIK